MKQNSDESFVASGKAFATTDERLIRSAKRYEVCKILLGDLTPRTSEYDRVRRGLIRVERELIEAIVQTGLRFVDVEGVRYLVDGGGELVRAADKRRFGHLAAHGMSSMCANKKNYKGKKLNGRGVGV